MISVHFHQLMSTMNLTIDAVLDETPSMAPRELEIRECVMTAFQESGYHRLCQVRCHVQGDVVELGGHVSSFHLKQVAQTLAMQACHGWRIRNEICVS